MLEIRKCGKDEFETLWPELERIFRSAKAYMRRCGNYSQWTGSYPDKPDIRKDVDDDCFFLVFSDNRIVGCFCMRPSPEPTYAVIEDGSWPDDNPYNVIHRLASDGSVKGLGRFVLEYCLKFGNVRIDTHRDNTPMLHLLKSAGFARCGIIRVSDGTAREAFCREGMNG